jgi:hypothetical protein
VREKWGGNLGSIARLNHIGAGIVTYVEELGKRKMALLLLGNTHTHTHNSSHWLEKCKHICPEC